MCGISGIRAFRGQIKPEQITALLWGLHHRGTDASGIALANSDTGIAVCKSPKPAWEFLASEEYKNFITENLRPTTWAVLAHVRQATQGTPSENGNNHPLFKDKSAVVHNGIIFNDDVIFRQEKLDRNAETDSDILRAILDKHGFTQKGIRALSKVSGTVAAAALHQDFPGKLLLLRSGGPLTIAATEDQLLFASEKQALHRALRPWVTRFGIPVMDNKVDAGFATMALNSAWLFGAEGLEWHQEFTVTAMVDTRQAGYYQKMVQKSSTNETLLGVCPSKTCGLAKKGVEWTIQIGKKPKDFRCSECNSTLVAAGDRV